MKLDRLDFLLLRIAQVVTIVAFVCILIGYLAKV